MTEAKKNISSQGDWPISTERFVTYIDIMGFKNIVARSTHEEVYEMMMKIDGRKKIIERVEWVKESPSLVKTTTYSDSIMIYSKDSSSESMKALISSTASLTDYMLTEGIPFKGAAARGLMTLDFENSIFFGQPLIDAYLLQEELYFYGIILHSTFEKAIMLMDSPPTSFIDDYVCPLKNGTSNHVIIYPMHTRLGKVKGHEANNKILFESLVKLRLRTSGYLRKYIDNTESLLVEIAGRGNHNSRRWNKK
jgi:hypothetical protein